MATEMPTQTGVFTRASSGLVRQVKTVDVMSYGIQQIALSYIVFIVLVWLFYPGANDAARVADRHHRGLGDGRLLRDVLDAVSTVGR